MSNQPDYRPRYCVTCLRALDFQGYCPVCPLECDGCRQELTQATRGDLKGLCRQCCQGLGGGKFSARIIKSEAAALKQRAASR